VRHHAPHGYRYIYELEPPRPRHQAVVGAIQGPAQWRRVRGPPHGLIL